MKKQILFYLILQFLVFILAACRSGNENIPISGFEPDSPPPLTKVKQNDQYIPLVVILYEHYDLKGVRRYVINDYSSFDIEEISFNDATSSISVHKGPDYQNYIDTYGIEPRVTFWEHTFSGDSITLEAGEYKNLGLYNLNDKISSVQFLTTRDPIPPVNPGNAVPFNNIYLVARLWKHSYSGWQMVILGTDYPQINDISQFYFTFGPGTANQISSLKVSKGPNWNSKPSSGFRLWTDDFYGGGYQTYSEGQAVGFLYNLNDLFSSSKFVY